MIDRRFLFDNIEFVKEMIAARGYSDVNVDLLVQEEKERKKLLNQLETLRHDFNKLNKSIGLKKQKNVDVGDDMKRVKELADQIKDLEGQFNTIDNNANLRLLTIPNVPHSTTPVGQTEADNVEVKRWGDPPEFAYEVRHHQEIGEALGIMDFERAAKVTGSRFAVMKGDGALLERALIRFMLETHINEHGYTEILPPFMANRESMVCTGQIPNLEEDMFKCVSPEYYLIPTGEVPITNLHRDEVLEETDLPVKYVCWTPCFRREAGTYGRESRGLIRQHQFNKVELVKLAHPDRSYDELEQLLKDAETILQLLGLPYRVVVLNTSDLSFSAAKCYDIEVWIPSLDTYKEISSCSNFEDFQARRANIKFQPGGSKKKEFIHTLNGSGLAIGRTIVALLENNQQEDGSVFIPEPLRPYMNGKEFLEGWPSGLRRRS